MPDQLVKLYELPDQGTLASDLRAGGIEIRRALAPEKHQILTWVREHFNQRWADECDVAIARLPVTCYIAVEKEKLIGFACYDATCKAFFGPTGVDESCRGKGVGKALLFACLEAMRAEGYAYAIIGAAGPVDFYARTVGAVEIPGSSPGIYRGILPLPPSPSA
ncbi:GNAT family N-acetyltransferase [Cohnella nanjingensis]|uniref:GNAT family N-acetyltransferase n=1 Tax=Cohnella nanjingensis TaxID=1387779 RepID=A0A7X0VK19_9BACL|nr:GNAT family N-acetyltransferase [Cohnella nanjingensis]MBB6675324.1 GNAT family N-acetyltransferase [Cohnella nanjingensis]